MNHQGKTDEPSRKNRGNINEKAEKHQGKTEEAQKKHRGGL